MSQLKFCLKTFETSSLLYVSVRKGYILAIILFEYLLLYPNAKRGPKLFRGRKNFKGARALYPLLSSAYGLPSGVTFLQQCFKPGLVEPAKF